MFKNNFPEGYADNESIAAIASAQGQSAICIIRVCGKDCVRLLAKVFSRPKHLTDAKPNSAV
ncbi:MAG: tRNA uridine-5-carboxymethylaminomethyl(34) synthesis GTPase MnmE, partial [Spirochaetaceae bacterium]|nr:tRNA uridine-5-carboxymethylaminomethyl(34) synthesis GTPase MnmE [Spirochaetaceae bacterium]